MGEWKYKVGDVIFMGKPSRIVVTGRREEDCEGGNQRFYMIYQIVESYTGGVGVTTSSLVLPAVVLEEMDNMAKEGKKEK